MSLKLLVIFAMAGAGWYLYTCMGPSPPPPEMNPHEWWGPNEMKGKLDHSIRPFKIKFDEEVKMKIIHVNNRDENVKRNIEPVIQMERKHCIWINDSRHLLEHTSQEEIINLYLKLNVVLIRV